MTCRSELTRVKTPADNCTHLECLAKLVTHYVVQQRIDAGGQKVEHAGCIVQHIEDVVEPLRLDAKGGAVDSHQALCVEGRPANEEGNSHSDCKSQKMNLSVVIESLMPTQQQQHHPHTLTHPASG